MTPDRADEIRAWLDGCAEEMAELLQQLVAVDTEYPPGRGLGRCAESAARGDGPGSGFSPERDRGRASSRELEDPLRLRGSAGDGASSSTSTAHFDVVPAQSPAQFEPRRRDGRIVGRGSADMKGGLVSMLYGAAAAAELGLLDGRRIVFHFVCDEETGSAAGSGHLREAGLIDRDALAMPTAEPTGGVIWHACRGAITLRVQTAGREAHVGYVHEGINAFEHMIRIAEPLTTLSHALLEQRTASPSRATRPAARCSSSAARPAPVPASTPCPARPGSRSTGASTPRRSSRPSSSGDRHDQRDG